MTGVTDANLAAVNDDVAASTNTALTTADIQLIVGAVVNINSWEGGSSTATAPTIAGHYNVVGVTGVTDANLAAVNDACLFSPSAASAALALLLIVGPALIINSCEGGSITPTAPPLDDPYHLAWVTCLPHAILPVLPAPHPHSPSTPLP